MNASNLLWPAMGIALVYASKKISGIPDAARGPLMVIGTLIAVKNVAVIQNRI